MGTWSCPRTCSLCTPPLLQTESPWCRLFQGLSSSSLLLWTFSSQGADLSAAEPPPQGSSSFLEVVGLPFIQAGGPPTAYPTCLSLCHAPLFPRSGPRVLPAPSTDLRLCSRGGSCALAVVGCPGAFPGAALTVVPALETTGNQPPDPSAAPWSLRWTRFTRIRGAAPEQLPGGGTGGRQGRLEVGAETAAGRHPQ